MQPRLHRAGSAPHDLGDLLDRHVLEEPEREHPAVIDGQAEQRGVDQFRVLERRVIVARGIRRTGGDVLEKDRPPDFLSQLGDRPVVCDAVHPDAERGRGPESPQPSVHRQPDRLQDVEGPVGLAEDPADEVEQPLVVQVQEPAECIPIALLGEQDRQLFFDLPRVVGHRGRPWLELVCSPSFSRPAGRPGSIRPQLLMGWPCRMEIGLFGLSCR
jgi:hypothetical protein